MPSVTTSYNLCALYHILSKGENSRGDYYNQQKAIYAKDVALRMKAGEQLPPATTFLQSLPNSGSAIALELTTEDVTRLVEQNESKPVSLALSFHDLLSRSTSKQQQNGVILEFLAMTANNMTPHQFSDPNTLPIMNVEIARALSWRSSEQVSSAIRRIIERLPYIPELKLAATGLKYLAGLDDERLFTSHAHYSDHNASLIIKALRDEILKRVRHLITASTTRLPAIESSPAIGTTVPIDALTTNSNNGDTDCLVDVLPASAVRAYSSDPMLHDLLIAAHYSCIPGLSEEVSFMLTGASGKSVFLETSIDGDGYVLNILCSDLFNTTENNGKPPKNVLQMLRRKGVSENSQLYRFWKTVYNETWGHERILTIAASADLSHAHHVEFFRGIKPEKTTGIAKVHRNGPSKSVTIPDPNDNTSDSEEDSHNSSSIFNEAMRTQNEIPENILPLLRLEVESGSSGSRSKAKLYLTKANGSESLLSSFRPHRTHAATWKLDSGQSVEETLTKALWNLHCLQHNTSQ